MLFFAVIMLLLMNCVILVGLKLNCYTTIATSAYGLKEGRNMHVCYIGPLS